MSEQLTPDRILETGLAFMASKVLLSALELNVFSELAKTPADLGTLTRKFQLHPRSAADFFDTLVAMKFLNRDNGVYTNTPEAAKFLDKTSPDYIGGMLEMCNARLYTFWGSLTEGLRTGKPQNEIKAGEGLFEKLYENPERLENFLKAMTGLSKQSARAIAAKFEWKAYRSFIDVGTAQGAVPVELALAHRHLVGAGMDLPVVRPIFEKYIREHNLADRVSFVARDFFKETIPQADVIIMGHILHDWGMDDKRMLLKKTYEALPKGGAAIIYDCMIDDERKKNIPGLLMSLNMLIETPEGFDYTTAQGQTWLQEAGFKQTRAEHLSAGDWMVVGIK
ncbi:MAG TPA: methyltransferase [Tepidisphaeraceae bacterium]|jgi:precorrin-6B methylase 2